MISQRKLYFFLPDWGYRGQLMCSEPLRKLVRNMFVAFKITFFSLVFYQLMLPLMRYKKVCIVSEVNATVRPFFLAFVATQRELVDDGDQPINALHLELCKMDAPESKIWKLKRSACRTLSNIVKRISSHSTQWSDSHTHGLGCFRWGGGQRGRGKVENLRACCCLHSSGSVSPVGCNRFRCLI